MNRFIFFFCLILAGCSGNIEADKNAAKAFLESGKAAQAEELLLKSFEAGYADADACNLLGISLTEQKKHSAAVSIFGEAIKKNNGDYRYYFNRGNAYLGMDDAESALKDYDRALELRGDVYDLFLNRANALAALNRLNESLADYNRAEQLRADDPLLYFNRGRVGLLAERFGTAVTDLHKAAAALPDKAEAHYFLALAEIGRADNTFSDESCAHLRRAADLGYEKAVKLTEEMCK